MRVPNPTPTLVPEFDCTVHIVLDCFGKAGCAYRETDEEESGTAAVIDNLFTGQFNNPVRVIAFNTAEGWSRDVAGPARRIVPDRSLEIGNLGKAD